MIAYLLTASIVVSFTTIDGERVQCTTDDLIRMHAADWNIEIGDCETCVALDSIVYVPSNETIEMGRCVDRLFKDGFEDDRR